MPARDSEPTSGARDSGSGEQRRPARERLFLALDLPDDVRESLAHWRDATLAVTGGMRPLDDAQLHVTLCFLGWQDLGVAGRIAELAATAAPPAVTALELGEALWLPKRRPRVLTVAVRDPNGSLGSLQADLAERMRHGIGWKPEQRAFLPHVTVARAKRGGGPPRGVAPPAPPRPLRFDGAAVTLYRSLLRPSGAVYEPVHRWPSGG
jgi:2'-5' RNA ligase